MIENTKQRTSIQEHSLVRIGIESSALDGTCRDCKLRIRLSGADAESTDTENALKLNRRELKKEENHRNTTDISHNRPVQRRVDKRNWPRKKKKLPQR